MALTKIQFDRIQTINTSKLLGVGSAGTNLEEITLGTNLSMTGTTLNASGGGTPGGSTTEIQWNNASSFDGISTFTTDGTDITGTGLLNLSGGTLRVPVSATPSLTLDGHLAFDTTVTDFTTGVLKFYGNEEQGIVSMPIAQFTTPTDGYVVTYDATNDEFKLASAGSSPFALKLGAALDTTLRVVTDGAPTSSELYLASNKSAFSGTLGINSTAAHSYQLYVLADGNTSATSSFRVENSSNVRALEVRDDGWVLGPSNVSFGFIAQKFAANTVGTEIRFDSTGWLMSYLGTTFAHFNFSNGSSIGNGTRYASAVLALNSTTQGFLPPRMTGTQAEAISTPQEGLLVYSTDGSGSTITSKGWWGYDGSTWVKLN